LKLHSMVVVPFTFFCKILSPQISTISKLKKLLGSARHSSYLESLYLYFFSLLSLIFSLDFQWVFIGFYSGLSIDSIKDWSMFNPLIKLGGFGVVLQFEALDHIDFVMVISQQTWFLKFLMVLLNLEVRSCLWLFNF